jgi:hypothetical protein
VKKLHVPWYVQCYVCRYKEYYGFLNVYTVCKSDDPLPNENLLLSNNPMLITFFLKYNFFKVDFRYWGLQSKVERFIHDYGLRRVMLRAHRQAWAWQDEWVGLTMDDIRRLERETQVCCLNTNNSWQMCSYM